MTRFAYLAHGKLHLKHGAEPVSTLESQFAQTIRQRAIEINRRHEWKEQGRGAQFMRGGTLWARRDAAALPIAISGLSRGWGESELVYSLETPEVTGIFLLQDEGRRETRILHSADFRAGQVTARPGRGDLAFALRDRGGASHIAVMGRDGSDFAEVTQGDSMDASPHWMPGEERALLFQSAGIARDEQGNYRGRGPFAIHRVELDSGLMTTLAEDEKFDFLSPRMAPDGALYYIRRPYEQPMVKMGIFRSLLELALFPFRLLYAFFQFLNIFSMMYTGNPLTTAGGARQQQADARQMTIWGNLVNAQDAIRRARTKEDAPALVPDSWELLRQAGGATQVIARGVLSFDLASEGSVLYSHGSAVFRLDSNGQCQCLHKDKMIEHLVALS
jgi:hypothetical protein